MKRPIIVVAALAIAVSALAQETQSKLTYSTVAVTISRALEEISKKTGSHLGVAPIMAGEIVIISLRDCPLDEAKVKIAAALTAKWENTDNGPMLVPDIPARRLEQQKEQADYTAQIAKGLKQLVDSLNPPKADPNSKNPTEQQQFGQQFSAQFGFGAAGNASGKAIIRLAQGIGATALGSIDEKTRIVYSSNPTRMQRPLPGNANAILSTLVQEYNVEVKKRLNAKRDTPVNQEEDERMKKLREFFGNFEDDAKPIEGTPTKALLVCSRQPLLGGLTMNLKVYNEKGQVIITGSQGLAGDNSYLESMNLEFDAQGNPKPKQAPVPPKGEQAITFSESTKEFQESGNVMAMAQGGGKKMSDELRAKLLHPEMYDPLSFTHSEALIETAKQRGKQLVAVLPDGMQSFMSFAMSMTAQKTTTTPTSYLDSIKNQATITTDTLWMVVRPSKPADARKRRMDRLALGTFIRTIDAKGAFGLDDLAAYAQHSVSPMEDTGAFTYIMLFAPNAIQSGMSGSVNWDMLRFYGSLSTLQRKNLADGGRMAFAQCTPAQAASLRQMAFGPEEMLNAEDPNGKKPDYEMPAIWRQMFQRAAGGDYRTEPTEVMPNGLPAEGYLQLHLTKEGIVKPAGNVPSMFGNAVMGADELAMLKYFRESEAMAQFAAMIPQIEDVKLGERAVYEFKFTVAQGVTMTQILNDDKMDANAKVIKMANLPADFAKKIDERIAMIKKIPFFDPMFLGGGQRATPPPAN